MGCWSSTYHRLLFGLAFAALSGGCGSTQPGLTGEIRADGSSTVHPLTQAVAQGFGKLHPGVKVTVAISGTTGGFEKFCRGETDIEDASRPITTAERQLCRQNGVEYIEVPVAHDGLTIIVNARNSWATAMTVAELRKLWAPDAEHLITRWSQVRAGWPDDEIHLFGPDRQSGTFDYFTEAIVGTVDASRTDFAASADDMVIVSGVGSDPQALGYVGYGYFEQNRAALQAVAIDDGDDSVGPGAIAPSPENVRRGVYRPLSRTLLIYVNTKSLDRREVAEFVNFYLKKDEQMVSGVGGIAMSSRSYELVRQRVSARTSGTLFAGGPTQVGDLELLLAQAR